MRVGEKIRQQLTSMSNGELHFEHEGEGVTRRITGGTLPDICVTFHQRDTIIEVRCPTCQILLGCFPSHYGGDTAQRLAAIRQNGHRH